MSAATAPTSGGQAAAGRHICRDLIQQPLRASEVLDRLPRLRCKALVCPRLWWARIGQMPHYQDRQHNQMHRLAHISDSTPAPVLGLPEPARRQCRSEPLAPIDRPIPEPDSRRRHPLLKQRTYTSPYLIGRQLGMVEPHRHDEPPKLRQDVWIVNVDHRAAFYGYLKAARAPLARCYATSLRASGYATPIDCGAGMQGPRGREVHTRGTEVRQAGASTEAPNRHRPARRSKTLPYPS